jgi:hypothetical protein
MNHAAFLKQVIIAFICSTSRSQPSSKPFLVSSWFNKTFQKVIAFNQPWHQNWISVGGHLSRDPDLVPAQRFTGWPCFPRQSLMK